MRNTNIFLYIVKDTHIGSPPKKQQQKNNGYLPVNIICKNWLII